MYDISVIKFLLFALLFKRSTTGSLSNLHFCLQFQLFGFLLSLVFFDLLCSKLIDIARR
jgi:hypothetical protein